MKQFSNPAESVSKWRVFSWLLFPIALFPLLSLATYDWHAIEELAIPAAPTSNWIGPIGDRFAYHAYTFFGLAAWIIPLLFIALAFVRHFGGGMKAAFRVFWIAIFIGASSCLMQVIAIHTAPVRMATNAVNIANAGGVIGYLTVTRFLTPIVSDFAAAIIVSIVMVGSLIAAVGFRNLLALLIGPVNWALARNGAMPAELPPDATPEEISAHNEELEKIRLAQAAREAARRQREEDKRLAHEAKQAAREAKIAEKEQRRLEKAAAKNNAALPQDEEPLLPPIAPIAKPARAAAKPAAAAKKPASAEPAPDDKGPYMLPTLSLLNPLKVSSADHSDVGEMKERIVDTLKLFGIDATVAYDVQGPVVTKYALSLAPGTRYQAVTNVSDNLMGALRAKSLRIEAPIPGEDHIGIEVPNAKPAGISFREIFESPAWRNFKGELPLLFGKDAAGHELIADLASMPHMLVAGATGQGKSVCLNAIINGLLMSKTPEQLKLIMVDPKSVEFTSYAAIPHLIVPIITENRKAATSLIWAVAEMEKRLKLFSRVRVRNIYDFNHRLQFTQTDMFGADTAVGSDIPKTVPYIVIIIDEVADLMSQCAKEVVPHISRLTAKARAAGIHLILATQRPDSKVITGTIKANIPGRVAFKTATAIDSRTILDDGGAENLIGRGDMLFKSKEGLLIRAQGAWISDEEIARITAFIEQHANTQFDEKFKKNLDRIKDQEIDPFAELNAEDNEAAAKENAVAARAQIKADAAASDFIKAVECVVNTKRASTSHFQRQMGWGYNHAAKILDMLTERGIVSPQSGMGPRQIIMSEDDMAAIIANEGGSSAETESATSDDGELPLMAADDNENNETLNQENSTEG